MNSVLDLETAERHRRPDHRPAIRECFHRLERCPTPLQQRYDDRRAKLVQGTLDRIANYAEAAEIAHAIFGFRTAAPDDHRRSRHASGELRRKALQDVAGL